MVAVAAGTVVSAGYSGGGGNMVRLKHAGRASRPTTCTCRRTAPGSAPGAHVAQGQLIGRVGMTGTATGPHLDYRLKRNGVFVNPVSVHSRQAPGEPIPAAQLANFKSSRDTPLTRLSATLLAEAPRQKPDAVPAVTRAIATGPGASGSDPTPDPIEPTGSQTIKGSVGIE